MARIGREVNDFVKAAMAGWKMADDYDYRQMMKRYYEAIMAEKLGPTNAFNKGAAGYDTRGGGEIGDLSGGGGDGRPTAQQIYNHVIEQGGDRNMAALLTSAAASESRFNPSALHDKNKAGQYTGYGIFGHRLDRRDALFKFAGSNNPDWRSQVNFAMKELREGGYMKGLGPDATPEQLTAAQMHFERPQGYTPKNPQGGHNWSGRLANTRAALGLKMPAGRDTPPMARAAPPTREPATNVAEEPKTAIPFKSGGFRAAPDQDPMARPPQGTPAQSALPVDPMKHSALGGAGDDTLTGNPMQDELDAPQAVAEAQPQEQVAALPVDPTYDAGDPMSTFNDSALAFDTDVPSPDLFFAEGGTVPAAPPDPTFDEGDPIRPPESSTPANPLRSLGEALHGGLTYISRGLGQAKSALPGTDPAWGQNVKRFASGADAASPDEVRAIHQTVDPKGALNEGMRNIAGLNAVWEFYTLRGDYDKANKVAASLMQYSQRVAAAYGDRAAKLAQAGDFPGAVAALKEGYNYVPDGNTADAQVDRAGNGVVEQKDASGRPVGRMRVNGQMIMAAALGLRNGQEYWSRVMEAAAAGRGDPDAGSTGAYKQAMALLGGAAPTQTAALPGASHAETPTEAEPDADEDDTLTTGSTSSGDTVGGGEGDDVLQGGTDTLESNTPAPARGALPVASAGPAAAINPTENGGGSGAGPAPAAPATALPSTATSGNTDGLRPPALPPRAVVPPVKPQMPRLEFNEPEPRMPAELQKLLPQMSRQEQQRIMQTWKQNVYDPWVKRRDIAVKDYRDRAKAAETSARQDTRREQSVADSRAMDQWRAGHAEYLTEKQIAAQRRQQEFQELQAQKRQEAADAAAEKRMVFTEKQAKEREQMRIAAEKRMEAMKLTRPENIDVESRNTLISGTVVPAVDAALAEAKLDKTKVFSKPQLAAVNNAALEVMRWNKMPPELGAALAISMLSNKPEEAFRVERQEDGVDDRVKVVFGKGALIPSIWLPESVVQSLDVVRGSMAKLKAAEEKKAAEGKAIEDERKALNAQRDQKLIEAKDRDMQWLGDQWTKSGVGPAAAGAARGVVEGVKSAARKVDRALQVPEDKRAGLTDLSDPNNVPPPPENGRDLISSFKNWLRGNKERYAATE